MSKGVGFCALLTKAEAAEALRISTRTLDRLAERGVLAPVRYAPRGRVHYRLGDVERAISPNRGAEATSSSAIPSTPVASAPGSDTRADEPGKSRCLDAVFVEPHDGERDDLI
jgi:hypothetical protein